MQALLSLRSGFGVHELRSAALVFVGCALVGCVTPLHVEIPPRVDRPTTGQIVEAGAAKADITPIPGIPMGGYSIEGKLSRGVWTRLFARAIYLQDDQGTPLVLVSCDLLYMPAGLVDQVAKLVWEAGLNFIGRENIVLAATHSHHGPAGFFTTLMNTSPTSPSPQFGFDHELFDFLARRISDAIVEAVGAAVPAKLAVELADGTGAANNALDRVFRNRSLDAYLLNPDASDQLSASPLSACDQAQPSFPLLEYPDPRACQAVDPDVEVIVARGTAAGNPLIAVAAFLASHPTVLDSQTEVYTSDFFGAAATRLESDLLGSPGCERPTSSGPDGCPVVALFNGAEGDISPNWTRRDRADLLGLAEKLALKIETLVAAANDVDFGLSFQYDVIQPIAGREFSDHSTPGRLATEQRIPDTPRPSAAQLGGAEDGRTGLYEQGMQEGRRKAVRDEHGTKTPPFELAGVDLGEVALAVFPPASRAPLTVYNLTPKLALVALPGEFTTAMGERVREQVTQAPALAPGSRVLLAGMAGGHISYITTPEEYDAQSFEGGSNLYGPATGPMLAHELNELAKSLPASTPPGPTSASYEVFSETIFRPHAIGAAPYSYDDGLGAIASEITAPFAPNRSFPAFCFKDAVPRLSEVSEATGPCRRSLPEVAVRKGESGGTTTQVADSWGLEVVTVMTQVAKDHTQWCAIWLRPEAVKESEESYHFHVDRIRGAPLESEAFTPAGYTFTGTEDHLLEANTASDFWCSPALDWLGLCSDTCEEPP